MFNEEHHVSQTSVDVAERQRDKDTEESESEERVVIFMHVRAEDWGKKATQISKGSRVRPTLTGCQRICAELKIFLEFEANPKPNSAWITLRSN